MSQKKQIRKELNEYLDKYIPITELDIYKYVVDFIKKDRKKQLTLTDASQQRELLEGFVDWFNANDKTQAILSERIEEYLKTL